MSSRKEGCPGRWYSPTLLRELLLSESEGMMDKTLYVEPGDRKRGHLLLTPKGFLILCPKPLSDHMTSVGARLRSSTTWGTRHQNHRLGRGGAVSRA